MTPVNVVNFMVPFPVLGMLTRKILSSVADVLTGNSRKPFASPKQASRPFAISRAGSS